MRENNRGFTLVELIVALSIFGIVVAAAFGFMVAGSNTYDSVGTRLNLQLDAQLAANQIEELLIDCNGNVFFDGDTLFVINPKGEAYTAHVFEYENERLDYTVAGAEKKTDGSFNCIYTAEDLLCAKVKDFHIVLNPVGGERADYADFSLTLQSRGKSYTIEKTVALRNNPTVKNVENVSY